MMAAPSRILTPARIVAIALIAVAVAGLAYLRFASPGGQVSLPAGAHAGQLVMHGCSYSTEHGSYAADCGTLVVRENRHSPHSRLIALPVTRIRARSAHPGTAVFRLQGGPGLSNMSFPQADRFAADHDVVLVGYRGVDGSSKLDCPEVSSARAHADGFLTQKAYAADAAAFRDCAARLQRSGADLAGYTLPERVDDLDAARSALGYPRVDLVSESAGTRTAMIYAWRHPARIERSVMIGVNPPGHFLWDAKTTGEQIDRYAALCARDASCRRRTPDLTAAVGNAYRHVPGHFGFLPIEKGNVQAAGFFGLMNATTEGGGPLSGPMTIDTLLSAGKGDGSGAWLLSVMAQLVFPHAQVWGDVAAVGRTDASYVRRFFASGADRGSAIGSPGTDLIWAGGRLLDAWPASPDENQYTRVQDSQVPTLLIGGSLDFATPPQWATRDLLPHLPNGRQVVLPGLGHTDDVWSFEPAASSRLINGYLADGRVDTSLYRFHSVDLSPSLGHGGIAKIVLAVALAFTAIALASLLWLPWRVWRRGGLSRRGGAAVRSLYPLVLGLGGWFAAALVVLTASLSVPIDNQLLVAVSVGGPIGLGIYWGWVQRDFASRRKTAGLAAALGGALLGAALGFGAGSSVIGVVTAIVGATAGANLLLLMLDIGRDGTARELATAPRSPALAGAGRVRAR